MKSYQQYCGLALALDRIGDRWTLLIVRELLTGPKRFTDLLAGLPNIPTNLLTRRLRRMESDLLIDREVIPPPSPAELYALTDLGGELESAVLALVQWGGKWMSKRGPNQAFRSHWLVIALRALLPNPTGVRLNAVIALPEGRIGVVSTATELTFVVRPPEDAECVVQARAELLLGLAAGVLDWAGAREAGLKVEGSQEQIRAVRAIFSWQV
jgi:DNA-binding HxlR family transcriptional regulator